MASPRNVPSNACNDFYNTVQFHDAIPWCNRCDGHAPQMQYTMDHKNVDKNWIKILHMFTTKLIIFTWFTRLVWTVETVGSKRENNFASWGWGATVDQGALLLKEVWIVIWFSCKTLLKGGPGSWTKRAQSPEVGKISVSSLHIKQRDWKYCLWIFLPSLLWLSQHYQSLSSFTLDWQISFVLQLCYGHRQDHSDDLPTSCHGIHRTF